MAKVTYVSSYPVNIQAQPEKSGVDKNGKPYKIDARPASKATIMVAEYEETVQQFLLPENFNSKDFGVESLKKGDILVIRCPDLEKIRPFAVYNVDRVIQQFSKEK